MKRLRMIILIMGLFISIQFGIPTTFASTVTKVPVEGIIKKYHISDRKSFVKDNQLLPQLNESNLESKLCTLVGIAILLFVISIEIVRRKNTDEKI